MYKYKKKATLKRWPLVFVFCLFDALTFTFVFKNQLRTW